MPTKNVIQLSGEIPEEVRRTIKGLGDEVRLALLVALLKNDRKTFTQLKKTLGINASSLSYHLTLLQDGGLVTNFVELGDNLHSYYVATEMTETVLGSLYDIILGMPSMDINASKYLSEPELPERKGTPVSGAIQNPKQITMTSGQQLLIAAAIDSTSQLETVSGT